MRPLALALALVPLACSGGPPSSPAPSRDPATAVGTPQFAASYPASVRSEAVDGRQAVQGA